MKDIHLTIGHNVNGHPTHTTRAVCATAARILEVEGFTAVPCLGMWRGEAEDSTRLEICGLDDEAARAVWTRVPLLAAALDQVEVMAEAVPSRIRFIGADAGARTA